jgi:hypothetical protein
METPLRGVRKEGHDPSDKERLPVSRAIAQGYHRSKTTVGKQCRRQRVRQQALVTAPQFWTGQDVKGSLRGREGSLGSTFGTELEFAKFERKS